MKSRPEHRTPPVIVACYWRGGVNKTASYQAESYHQAAQRCRVDHPGCFVFDVYRAAIAKAKP